MKPSERFMRALQRAEEEHSPEPLLELFDEESSLMRLNSDAVYEGHDGARRFWDEYFAVFRKIRSRFTHVIEADNAAVLEWEAEGTFENGESLHYRGVSIAEFEGEKVYDFRTYFDSAPFTAQENADRSTGAQSRPKR